MGGGYTLAYGVYTRAYGTGSGSSGGRVPGRAQIWDWSELLMFCQTRRLKEETLL